MRLGMIGLGKMGSNIVENLIEHDHEVVAYDVDKKAIKNAVKKGAEGAKDLRDMVDRLNAPKIVWLMIPHQFVDDTIEELEGLLHQGDIVIDGGNSHYTDSMRRAERMRKRGIHYLDVGTSGGVEGARHGACMMIGGPKKAYETLEPLFQDMNVKDGYFHCGPSGAGHYVKMVHNGVEYAVMQAYVEGFHLLKENKEFTDLDLEGIAHVWNHGSIVQSFLLEKIEAAFHNNGQDLKKLKPYVDDSGEGRWALISAVENGIETPCIAISLANRFKSQKESYADKLLAAIRNEFGGHKVKRK